MSNAHIDQIIREAAEKVNDPTNRESVVSEVMTHVKTEEYEPLLRMLLLDRVTLVFGNDRNAALNAVRRGSDTTITARGGTETTQSASTFVDIDAPAQPIRVNTAKRDSIRAAFFSKLISVGGGTMKKLGDLTVDDLRHVAEVRQKMANANQKQADSYSSLADLLEEKSLKRLGDAPMEDVRARLSNED